MVPVSNEMSFFHSKLDSELSRIIKNCHQKISVLGENQGTSCLKCFHISFCYDFVSFQSLRKYKSIFSIVPISFYPLLFLRYLICVFISKLLPTLHILKILSQTLFLTPYCTDGLMSYLCNSLSNFVILKFWAQHLKNLKFLNGNFL